MTNHYYESTLNSGIYYVKIDSTEYSSAASIEKYELFVTQLSQSSCHHNYGSTYINATYFDRGYTHYVCDICGHSYNGDYTPKLVLGKASLSSYSTNSGKGKINASWYTVSDASGYQIRYSTSKGMKKNTATVKIKNPGKTNKTIKNLKRKKTYYLQIRAYVASGSKTVYGKWSDKLVVMTR